MSRFDVLDALVGTSASKTMTQTELALIMYGDASHASIVKVGRHLGHLLKRGYIVRAPRVGRQPHHYYVSPP